MSPLLWILVAGTFAVFVAALASIAYALALGLDDSAKPAKRDEEVPDDYARCRAAALKEAADLLRSHMDAIGGEGFEMVAMRACLRDLPALGSPEYIGVRRADLDALLDLHDGEPLGLAVPAYDRLRAAVRRGRG